MEPKKFWTIPMKIALTIALAVLFFWLFGCSCPQEINVVYLPVPLSASGDTDVQFLQSSYRNFNEQYFNNHLDKNTKISVELGGENMADTWCDNDDGTGCTIKFNLHYVASPRVGQSTLLHEMCHVKIWSKNLPQNRPEFTDQQHYDHGRLWRTCMLNLDSQGAFREINIDYYREAF